jgi:murein DD-endopeptidase MepM/ murein hydrolase activator NlpD
MADNNMSSIRTRFTEMLIAANGIDPDAFQSWAFCPGMLFGSLDKWWGDHGERDFPHEGIDLCLYRDTFGNLVQLNDETRIPVMHDGAVKAMFVDFLGQAVIIEHDDPAGEAGSYFSAYAHTKPGDEIKPGFQLKAGDIIGTIADTSNSKAGILPHLHFTLGRPSPKISYGNFVWNIMRDPEKVSLLDPIPLIGMPCEVMDAQDPFCCGI